MKNIKIILIALTITLFASCDDLTNVVQPGELDPSATFQTVADLQQGLTGVYSAIPGENEIEFNSIFTDEVNIGFANGGQGLNDGAYGFVLQTDTADPYSIWLSNYTLINFANRLIAAAPNVVVEPGQEEEYADIVAQAHILRAYGHFKLISYFSTNIADDNALGCILVNFVPTIYQDLPRNTNGELFSLINSDLAYSDQLTSNADNSDNIYVSPAMVTAFKARIAAYREKYTEAEQYADELIGQYNLSTRGSSSTNSPYLNIWRDTPSNPNEVIFKLERVDGDPKIGNIWASIDATIGGSPFYGISTDLFNLFNYNFKLSPTTLQDDIRANAVVGSTSDFDNPDNPTSGDFGYTKVINKYAGSSGIKLLNDVKVFRLSEMYFIKAEARAAAGDFEGVASVLQEINNVRYKAGKIPVIQVPANAQAAWAEILNQRRIELCYEGHRWVDLKRLGVKAGVSINRNPADCAINGACYLPNTSYKFTMPIPQAEMDANDAIRSQQNPGY